MKMKSRHSEAGFSLVELAVAMGLATTLLAVLASVFTTSSDASHRSTTVLRLHEEHRRNLDSVANTLRGAVASTLGGFSIDGTATEPSFQRVTGVDEKGLVFGLVNRISWRPTTERVPGIERPGEVIVTEGGRSSIIARHVPAEGFRVARLGQTLRISITTYCSGPKHMLETISGQTSVTLRN